MKKTKLLSLILALALTLTTVFAGTETIFAGSVASGSVTYSQIVAQNMNTATEDNLLKYTATMTTGSDFSTVVPVTVSKAGTICVPLEGIAVGKGVTVSLHGTSAATDGDKLGYSKYLSSGTTQAILYAKVSKAGTYYLKFETSAYSAGTPQSVDFNCVFYPAGGTLKKGTTFYGASKENNAASQYKVTVPSNGYLTISFPEMEDEYSSFQVRLLNSSKKVMNSSDFEYISSSKSYKTRIGVKKGTYYIAVKNSDNAYGIKATFTAVSENSGSTKGKAKSISKGGTKKGIITAAQSSTSGDWYKFTVSKSQTVKFSISSLTSGSGLKIAFYAPGSSYPSVTEYVSYSTPSGTVQLYTFGNNNKLAPGTYYIKVQKYSGGNGYYKLKWLS